MTTQFAPLDKIAIEEKRQRRAFDEGKHIELCDSIQNPAIGLMHPVVLRVENGRMVLVAGERRLRAFKDSFELGVDVYHAGVRVPTGHIPYTDLGKMDPLDAWEAELEENIRRVDLTWQERANATQELLDLRQKQAEKKGIPVPTVAEIAEEVTGRSDGAYHSDTRRQIIVAKHLDDPDVAGAKTVHDAYKVLQRKESAAKNKALASSLGNIFTSDVHRLHHTDAEEWMKECPDASFDVILTDPPYGMGADEFGDSGGKTGSGDGAHSYLDTPDNLKAIMGWFPAQAFRVTKPDAHLYLFCDIDWFWWIRSAMAEAGWKVFRTPLIWAKPTAFRAPWPEQGPQRKYETILYAVKGEKKTQHLAGDVLTYTPDENLGHAAQKPVALYKDLLSRSIIPGNRVLDPFCGTGPIFPAAHILKVFATGVEMDPASYAIAATRIKGLE